VKIGVMTFPTSVGSAPNVFATAVEEHRFDSMLFAEHTHIPIASSERPRGGTIPADYRRVLDPFVALTAAASATSTLRIGTGIFLASHRDPISIAKATATLDVLSGGRLVFGVGFGWNQQEMANHGVDPSRKRSITREHMLAVRRLWTDDVASFEGDFVRITPSWIEPKPVQQPNPPIFLGADGGPGTFRHVAEWADGWYPNRHYDRIVELMAQLVHACEEAGRPPSSVKVMACAGDPNADGAGSSVDWALLDRLQTAGVESVILPVPPGPIDRQEPVLALYATAVDRYKP
jgi:probable F420-dependent oxidoreductase